MDRDEAPKPQDIYRKPLPVITSLNKPFWDYALKSVFALQVCARCGDAHLPPSPVCPKCLSDDQSWKPASGRGTLESWADFHRVYWDGFKEELPYRTCLVKLDEGPLIISNLVGDGAKTRIGARLRVTFERVTEEIAIPKFILD
jgi:uncharacterized protein